MTALSSLDLIQVSKNRIPHVAEEADTRPCMPSREKYGSIVDERAYNSISWLADHYRPKWLRLDVPELTEA